jgi:hypothetical protein
LVKEGRLVQAHPQTLDEAGVKIRILRGEGPNRRLYRRIRSDPPGKEWTSGCLANALD